MAAYLQALKTVTNLLANPFSINKPVEDVNENVVLLGAGYRKGLSAIEIAGNIIARKKKAGIPIAPLPSGGQNLDLIMETIRVEEIVKALLTDAKIQVSAPPGTLLQSEGANAGGPVLSTGRTLETVKSTGIIQ